MADLDIRTALTQIEKALTEVISLAYQVRLPPVADVTTLRSRDVTAIVDRDLIYCTALNRCFRWSEYSTSADDGALVIKPASIVLSAPGRWLQANSGDQTLGPNASRYLDRVQTGYARTVQLYEGEVDDDEAMTRIFGRKPAFLIQWLNDEPEQYSVRQGALYRVRYNFQIWCISGNLRPYNEALYGSPVAEEDNDPGLNRMIGDIRYLLAGINLGQPGVDFCQFEGADIYSEDYGERLFIGFAKVNVRASIHIPDEDLVALDDIYVQGQLADTHGAQRFDLQNYVAAGYWVATGPGLTRAPAVGSAVVGGVNVSSMPAPFTFSASRATYRDLRLDGTFIFTETAIGAGQPSQSPNTLRLGVTVTDGVSIISDSYLANTLINFGDQFPVNH